MVGTAAATYDIVSLVCLYVCTILVLEAPMHDTYRGVSTSQLSGHPGPAATPLLGKESLTRSRLKVPRLKMKLKTPPGWKNLLVGFGIIKESGYTKQDAPTR